MNSLLRLIPFALSLLPTAHLDAFSIQFEGGVPGWVNKPVGALKMTVQADGEVVRFNAPAAPRQSTIVPEGKFAGCGKKFTLGVRFRTGRTIDVRPERLGQVLVPAGFSFGKWGFGVQGNPRRGGIGFSDETGGEGVAIDLEVQGLPDGWAVEIASVTLALFGNSGPEEAVFVDNRGQRAARVRDEEGKSKHPALRPFDLSGLEMRATGSNNGHLLTVMAGDPAGFRFRKLELRLVELP